MAITGPFIVFVVGIICVAFASLYLWIVQLGGGDFINNIMNVSPDKNVNAQVWQYFNPNLDPPPQIYVDDVPYKMLRWKYIKKSEIIGQTRYGIEYKPLKGEVPKPYYKEVNDDKLVQIGKENMENRGSPVWRILSDVAQSPVYRELESTRRQRDIAKVQARTANFTVQRMTMDEAVRKAYQKMDEGKIASSRNMRNLGNRYGTENATGQTNSEHEGDDDGA